MTKICRYIIMIRSFKKTSVQTTHRAILVIDTHIPNASPSWIVSGSFLFKVSGRRSERIPPRSEQNPKITNGSGSQYKA
jgi:hypothetical protein